MITAPGMPYAHYLPLLPSPAGFCYFCTSFYFYIKTLPVVHNFNSGPSILPKEVFEQASQAIMDFNHTGLSILEIGHRTPLFQNVLDEAIATLRELMQLDDAHEILFFAWRGIYTIFSGSHEPIE